MEKIWEVKDPEQYLRPSRKRSRSRRVSAPGFSRDPGRAYTLSLLFWGAGQSYNGEHGKALTFEILLITLIVVAGVSAVFHDHILLFVKNSSVPLSLFVLIAESLFFILLVFWTSVAGDAYRTAARSRSTRFTGTTNRIYPFLCSLFIPGWGQFLNGQPLKGSFFSTVFIFGMFAIFTIPGILLLFPFLDHSEYRFVVDAIFAMTALYSPLVLLLWVLGAYDALVVSLDEYKKEPLWVRIKAANNRRRTQGWGRGVFPQVRTTLILILILAALTFVINKTFPLGFYTQLLIDAASGLREQGAFILPDIIDQVVSLLTHTGEPPV